MKLNLLIYKLEEKIRKIAIERLMMIITISMAIVFAADVIVYLASEGQFGIDNNINSLLDFDRSLIFKGQVWRVVSFVFAYPGNVSDFILVPLSLYFYYWTGTVVENYWGKARFNLFYFSGIILTMAAGFISGGATNIFLNLSIFLAFAAIFPEHRVLLFFIIPVKVKWIAIASAAFLLYYFVQSLVYDWQTCFSIIAAVINFLIFCGYDLITRLKSIWTMKKMNRR